MTKQSAARRAASSAAVDVVEWSVLKLMVIALAGTTTAPDEHWMFVEPSVYICTLSAYFSYKRSRDSCFNTGDDSSDFSGSLVH